jgi:hypothetical protein
VSPEAEAVVMKALARMPEDRYPTALEFAAALEKAIEPAYPHVVSDWIRSVANERLMELSELRARVDADTPLYFDDPSAPVVALDHVAIESEHPPRTRSHIQRVLWYRQRQLRSAGSALLGAALVSLSAFFVLRSPVPAASGNQRPRAAEQAPSPVAAKVVTAIEPTLPSAVPVAASSSTPVHPSPGPALAKSADVHTPAFAPFSGIRHTHPAGDAAPVASAPARAPAPPPSVAAPASDLEVIGGRE